MYVQIDVVDWSAFRFVKYDESKVIVLVRVRRTFTASEYVSSNVISPSDGTDSKSAVVYSFESRSPTMFRLAPFIIIFSCFGISIVRASMLDSLTFKISNVSSFVV